MKALQQFGEELKQNRLAQQISLAQVSAATRINERLLEAMESGKFSILPEPYIRAFIREYAAATELNPDEIIRKYHDAVAVSKPAPPPVAQPRKPERTATLAFDERQQARFVALARRAAVPGLFAAVALIAVLFIANSGSTGTPPATPSEVSFDRVVKESEAAVVRAQPALNKPERSSAGVATDSLHLEMTTLDSVWIIVVVDEKRTEEFLFPPRYHRRWIAKEQFSVTMGNASGATFRLNGKEIGMLGKPGAVVRNAVITEATIPNL